MHLDPHAAGDAGDEARYVRRRSADAERSDGPGGRGVVADHRDGQQAGGHRRNPRRRAAPVADLRDLEQKLRAIAKVSQTPFDQVQLKVSRNLEYENVLKVIDICARNKLTSGDQQTKVSIVRDAVARS